MRLYLAPVMVGLMAYFGVGASLKAEEPRRPAGYELRLQELENRRSALLSQSTGSIESKVGGISGSGPDPKDLERAAKFYERGKNLHKANDLEGALTSFQQAFALNPNNGDYAYEVASVYSSLQNYEKAAEFIDIALKLGNIHDELVDYQIGSFFRRYSEQLVTFDLTKAQKLLLRAKFHLVKYVSEHPDGKKVKYAERGLKLIDDKLREVAKSD